MNPFNKNIAVRAIVLVIFGAFLFECGKKAAPVPPRHIPPPAVGDLSQKVEGNLIRLTWTIPKNTEKPASRIVGFTVYRSKKPLSESDCKDCPVLFQRVADVPAEGRGADPSKDGAATYAERLEEGYRYLYKVTGYSRDGRAGGDSNVVEVAY